MKLPPRRPASPMKSPALWLFVVPLLLLATVDYVRTRQNAPDQQQRIAATLASWGLELDGIALPVTQKQIEEHVAMLRSPVSEARVQAADWLAARGLRTTAREIAAAMDDPGTQRPCQLAKSLGSLGDDQWTDKLIAATEQQSNTDLRVCATIALGDLQSPQGVPALIAIYRDDVAPTTAIEALGRIGDASALTFLQGVSESPRDEVEKNLAERAIARIHVLQQDDPVEALIQRVRRQIAEGDLKEWPIRKLATLQDARAVPVLRDAMLSVDQQQQTWLAAGLIAHGAPGQAVLAQMAEQADATGSGGPSVAVAEAARALITSRSTKSIFTHEWE